MSTYDKIWLSHVGVVNTNGCRMRHTMCSNSELIKARGGQFGFCLDGLWSLLEECTTLAERADLKKFVKSIDESLKARKCSKVCLAQCSHIMRKAMSTVKLLFRSGCARKLFPTQRRHASALRDGPLGCLERPRKGSSSEVRLQADR